ncbi:MAG TPA: hypothetical protein PLX69_12765 [Leptospiraceae bacterium]|nr:hypothetical protein [Leptospiraceae bacterium]HRG75424.1 hypothetical protein [Leptospiraceae bacterium]
MKNIESMSPRLYISFYISLLMHLSISLLVIFPFSHAMELICGIDEPVLIKEEISNWEELLSMEFSTESESDALEAGDKSGFKGNSKDESNEDNADVASKLDLDSLEKNGWKDLVKRLKDTKGLRKNFKEDFENIIKDGTVAESYIRRQRSYEDIIVKEVFPTIHSIEKPFQEDIKNSPEELAKYEERNEIIKKFRNEIEDDNEAISAKITKDDQLLKLKPPLKISEADKKKYFDNTLILPKEEQLSDFIEKFLGHDPDKGDLPLMFRDLYYQNLQRLAYTFSSDSTYFSIDYLQENLNKEDYLKNSMNLLSELKGTKTATEILFTLENIYEIQSNAIGQFFINENNLKQLPSEQKKQIRVETLRQTVERYAPILRDKKIKSHEDALKLYHRKKLEIMDYLLANTPENYRRSDAIFEKGRILWDRGMKTGSNREKKEAVQVWGLIANTPNSGDFLNKEIFQQMIPFIQEWKVSSSAQADMQISSLLMMRLSPSLNEKKLREDQLLWKKKIKDSPYSK